MAQVEETTSVVDWVSAGATITATLVALALGLGLIEWFRRPKLKLEHSPDVPSDRVVTLAIGGGIAAYLRARVSNGGKKSAKNVTVSVLSIEDWMSNTRRWMRRKPELDGRPLAFSNLPHDATVDVPAGVERYVDVVSIPWIAEQQGELPIRLEIREPFPANQAEWLTPGAWRLRLEVAAENVSAQEVELVIRFDGAWPADPPERIWDAVSIQGPVKPGSIAAPRAPLLLGPQQQLEQALAADEEAEDG